MHFLREMKYHANCVFFFLSGLNSSAGDVNNTLIKTVNKIKSFDVRIKSNHLMLNK